MSKPFLPWLALALCTALVVSADPVLARDDDDAIGFERTPPRLSFADGEVSFLRSGADDWTPARVNTALAAGDELYTGDSANLELQIGARAFTRAGENTQLGLTSLEPDFLQLRVKAGHVSLDLRSLEKGQTLELDTPNAAFTIERSGYYRVEVDGETTTFTSRRGGRASMTPAEGESVAIAASEQVVVSGTDAPQVESYAAPELDSWDRWNYARTDNQLDAVSARYVPPGVYGAEDLDHYGDWRVVPTYGAVWVPHRVAVGWVPYSTGRWMFDPYYGWTWVDDAPWGWAPYHYGRWVQVSGYWGWCPGPLVVRPYYAPALVAFYGGGGFSIGVRIGTPYVGWVALGWGEPLVPWWGPAHFREHAHWAGWAGPRYFNQTVVKNKTVYKARDINIYQNARVRDAIVQVDRDHFGRGPERGMRYTRAQPGKLSPLHGDVDVTPDRSSLVAEDRSAKRPPREVRDRTVVASREPRPDAAPKLEARRAPKGKPEQHARGAESGGPDGGPPARVVRPPHDGQRVDVSRRAPFGQHGESERSIPPPTPRYQRSEAERRSNQPPERTQPSGAGRGEVPTPRHRETGPPERGAPSVGRERAAPAPHELPGEPANRVYRGQERQSRMESESAPRVERARGNHSRGGDAGGGADERDQGRDQSRGH